MTSAGMSASLRLPRGNEIALACVAIVICLSPFFFGSTHVAFVAAWGTLLGIAACFAMPRGLSRKQLVLLGTVFAAFAAYLVVLHEQISPSPWFAAILNNPIWERSNLALGQSTNPIVAVVRDAPVVAVGAQLAFFLTLTLSFTLSADRQRARQLIRIVALRAAPMPSLPLFRSWLNRTKYFSGAPRRIILAT
jgi:hypothetical protein